MQQRTVTAAVELFLTRYNLFDKTFVVGFSGGFDSMCLLDVLSKLAINVVAAHFNHGWREEADAEEVACREFCLARNIRFVSEKANSDLRQTENDARIARYDFLQRVVQSVGADGIFTAHNADDNAETLIYRIAKGTGVYGLKGIAECRDNILRPLLRTSRADIERYCKLNNLTPNVDLSNSNTKYKRNLIRHEILPKLQEINKDVKSAINSLSELAELEELVVDEYLDLIRAEVVEGNSIYTQKFLKLSTPVKRTLLYSFLKNCLEEYSLKKVCEILDFIIKNSSKKSAMKMSLGTSKWLTVNTDRIFVYSDEDFSSKSVVVDAEGEYCFEGYKLVIKPSGGEVQEFPDDTTGCAMADLSLVEFPLEFRYGKPADQITPMGMTGKMLFKKYLSGKSVPQHKRKQVPVLAKDNIILWVPYLGVSADIVVKTTPTHILNIK